MFTIPINEHAALKLLQKNDAAELFYLVDQSRNYLREWLPWVDAMKQPEDYEAVIDMWLEQFAADDGFQAGIVYDGKIVGMIGFHQIDWTNKLTSIGYWLSASYQGKGIMTQAVKMLLDIAFKEYQLNRVEIKCGIHNERSYAIPERLGFKKEGILRDAEWLYDHFHDCYLYSMLASEWE